MEVKTDWVDTEDFEDIREPSVYDLKYLVYRLDLQKQFRLNDMETKLLSFILSFSQTSDKFYFGNESLARLFDKHTNTISSTVSSLEKKGLIKCTRRIKAGGGEIRFIHLTGKHEQTVRSQSIGSGAHSRLGENNNKININKYDISKDISGDEISDLKKEEVNSLKGEDRGMDNGSTSYKYGNEDINECMEYLKEKVGGQLDGTEKENRRYCYNLLRKIKKGYPQLDPVQQVKILINIATNDKFHSKNTTSFKYLFYNFVRIVKQAQEARSEVIEIK